MRQLWPSAWRGFLFLLLGGYILLFSPMHFALGSWQRWALGLALIGYGLWRLRTWRFPP